MKNLKYLIVGCGRSGTGFLASVISASGKNECGHEKIFNVYGINKNVSNEYESSWYSVPYLNFLSPNVKIVHIVRHPKKVIESFHRIGMFSSSIKQHLTNGYVEEHFLALEKSPELIMSRLKYVIAHRKMFNKYCNILQLENELLRLQEYWFVWNKRVEQFVHHNKNDYIRVNIEILEKQRDKLEQFIGINLNLEEPIEKNEKKHIKRSSIGAFELLPKIRELSKFYGYKV